MPGVVDEVCVALRYRGAVVGALNAEGTQRLPEDAIAVLEGCAARFEVHLERLGGPPPESSPQRLASATLPVTVCCRTWRRRSATACPKGKRLFRIGGDEFATVLAVADEEEAFGVGRALHRSVRGSGLGTVSIGVAVIDRHESDHDAFARADAALYAVKGVRAQRRAARAQGMRVEVGGRSAVRQPRDMTRWFTADLHLGHANIITYCGRPFADAGEMTAALIERWNDVVAPRDEVWVLGDVALGHIADTLPQVRRLHGQKVLVAGNHDRCWAGHRKGLDRWTKEYRSVGFAVIHQGAVEVELGGRPVLACHFPYRGDSQDEERHVGHRPADRGRWLVHGHVHDRWKVEGRQINVGVDVWDYRPVAEDVLAAIVTETGTGEG